MKLYQCILTQSDCYKRGRTILPKGVMIHSTGANNPKLSRYVGPDDGILGVNPNGNHWNNPGISKCVHAFIGKVADGTIATYQTLPWNHRAWHGGGSSNNSYIGFEICEDNLQSADYFQKAYQEAVELTAYLCEKFGLDPLEDGVVLCHQEGYQRGISSNHADVLHWFPKYGKNMDDFRRDVYDEIHPKQEEQPVTQDQFDAMMDSWLAARSTLPASDWAVDELEEAKEVSLTDGNRPQSFATRQEVAIMLRRATK